MERWKAAIYTSVAWVLFLVIAAGSAVWYISTHPMGPGIDEGRAQKAGLGIGFLFGGGLAAIWGRAIMRRRTHRTP